MLDHQLAKLYGVTTKRLNEQVRRNAERFPQEFMFSLSRQELADLRSQIATSSWGGRRYNFNVFTEHGALMAATVLNSRSAIDVSIFVVRAFVHLRDSIATHKDLEAKLAELEKKYTAHDQAIVEIIAAIRQLLSPAAANRRPIGFVRD